MRKSSKRWYIQVRNQVVIDDELSCTMVDYDCESNTYRCQSVHHAVLGSSNPLMFRDKEQAVTIAHNIDKDAMVIQC